MSLALPLSSSQTAQSHICAAMADHTSDIERASDSKEVSVDVTEKPGPRYYTDGVQRNKGIFGKARSTVPRNPLGF